MGEGPGIVAPERKGLGLDGRREVTLQLGWGRVGVVHRVEQMSLNGGEMGMRGSRVKMEAMEAGASFDGREQR